MYLFLGMQEESKKIIEHYLSNNQVTVALKPDDQALLRKLLYSYIKIKGDLMAVGTLLAYVSETLQSTESFPSDLAKIAAYAIKNSVLED